MNAQCGTTPTAMDRMPNELLVSILRGTPLVDLLRLNEVCTLWRKLEPLSVGQRTALTLVFQTDNSQTCLPNGPFSPDLAPIHMGGSLSLPTWPFDSEPSHLPINATTWQCHRLVSLLQRRMPKLESLQIVGQLSGTSVASLIHFLKLLSSSLVHFKFTLSVGSTGIDCVHGRRRLFRTLNLSSTLHL